MWSILYYTFRFCIGQIIYFLKKTNVKPLKYTMKTKRYAIFD